MNATEFKNQQARAFIAAGFAKEGKLLARSNLDTTTLVGFAKGFGNQWFIDVGFWLRALGSNHPDRIEQSHLYFRLERLCPEFHDVIAKAGALDLAEQQEASDALARLVGGQINQILLSLADKQGLKSALQNGLLQAGLIRREARDHLENPLTRNVD